jgi:hypothetical protein
LIVTVCFLSGINQPESPSDVATAYQKHGWGIIKAKDRTKEETKKEKKKKKCARFCGGKTPDQPGGESDSVEALSLLPAEAPK